jgi:protein TonB
LQLRLVIPEGASVAATGSAPLPADTNRLTSAEMPPLPDVAQRMAQANLDPSTSPSPQAATAYRETSGLDRPPRPLDAIDPEYPAEAGGIEGTVLLRLRINSSGGVDEVTVLRATPPGYFEASALAAFGRARYSPGHFLGIPVASQWLVEVGYTPINRVGAVSGQGR